MVLSQFCFSYGSGTLTSVFLDRVFSECLTYDGEMDYKTYLDFVIALENRQEPQSIAYLFRILDFDHKGYLTAFTLNYFYKVSFMIYLSEVSGVARGVIRAQKDNLIAGSHFNFLSNSVA